MVIEEDPERGVIQHFAPTVYFMDCASWSKAPGMNRTYELRMSVQPGLDHMAWFNMGDTDHVWRLEKIR